MKPLYHLVEELVGVLLLIRPELAVVPESRSTDHLLKTSNFSSELDIAIALDALDLGQYEFTQRQGF